MDGRKYLRYNVGYNGEDREGEKPALLSGDLWQPAISSPLHNDNYTCKGA
jgi:hypothetical protein